MINYNGQDVVACVWSALTFVVVFYGIVAMFAPWVVYKVK